MLRIGDFSKLARVGAKTLRYYDDIGLLKPAAVDEENGYRLYSVEQLPRLNRIMALKDLGFSLMQIGEVLAGGLSAAQLEGMLQLRQAEIEQQLQAERERLARVQLRLHDIRHEGTRAPYDVVLKSSPPQTIASVRTVVEQYNHVGLIFGQLFGALGRAGVQPLGPALCIYHDMEYMERDADIELAVPIPTAQPIAGLTVRVLPSIDHLLTTVHQGSYETLSLAYGAIGRWLQTNGYRIAAPSRDVFLRGPQTDRSPNDYLTEIQFPVCS